MSKVQAIIFAAVVACASSTIPAQSQAAPIVKTQNGDVQGVVGRQVYVFKGIPFAAPPVGDLRWREPQPAASWQGVRPASTFGSACMQTPGLSAANGGDAVAAP